MFFKAEKWKIIYSAGGYDTEIDFVLVEKIQNVCKGLKEVKRTT